MSDPRKPEDRHLSDPLFDSNEMQRTRARLHNLSDKQQGHALFIEEHRVEIQRTKEDVREIRLLMVTQAQLSAVLNDLSELRQTKAGRADLVSAQDVINTRLTALEASVRNELATLTRAVTKIDDNIGWAVKIVVGAILLALVGLLITNGVAKARAQEPTIHRTGPTARTAGDGIYFRMAR